MKKFNKVPYVEPKHNLKEKEYNFDDLLSEVQDATIQRYIKSDIVIRKHAVEVLRHFVFDVDGKIIRKNIKE